MRKIKLMADYECYPIWEVFSDGIDNIDPSSLPISDRLASRINNWADEYDQTLNHQDPSKSGFNSEEAMKSFEVQGKLLFNELKEELKGGFELSYLCTETGKLVT